MNFRFPKSEKLKSKKMIELLFAEGSSISKYPIKVLYLPSDDIKKTQAAFAVPKRNFISAVDRNRIKRQLREIYRLQKHLLKNEKELKFSLFFLYIGKEKLPYSAIETSITFLINKI
ncbi:MAG: ribonuclease P protein component [Flavobacteriaceae bacterium]|jgi:ribonuclease P protein component|nr:ribonuclease P protein component [Flavobacteriaceae bacterium]